VKTELMMTFSNKKLLLVKSNVNTKETIASHKEAVKAKKDQLSTKKEEWQN
jgi:hypothetical protein